MGLKIKLIILIAALLMGGGGVWHYKSIVNERNQLREDVLIYQRNEEALRQSLEDERVASAQAVSDRADIQRALDELREGRENDIEAQEWAATPLPVGERQRLCEALGIPDCE